MSEGYREQLLHVETADGLALAGAAIQPTNVAQPLAVVLIHGNTGAFFDYPYVLIGRELARQGHPVVIGNTRGHGVTSELWNLREDRPVAGGSAWELIEEAPYDIAAWIDAAMHLGAEGVVLVGHSQGAAKVVLYVAERQDPRVRGVVLASPDLHGHWPPTLVSEAEQMVAEGRDSELLPPLMGAAWYRLSAVNVVSRARVLSTIYDSTTAKPRISTVTCALLAFFGTRGDVGRASELDTIVHNAHEAASVTTHLIPDADHVYTDHEVEAAQLMAAWIKTLPGQPGAKIPPPS